MRARWRAWQARRVERQRERAWARYNRRADEAGLSKRERYEYLRAIGVTLPDLPATGEYHVEIDGVNYDRWANGLETSDACFCGPIEPGQSIASDEEMRAAWRKWTEAQR